MRNLTFLGLAASLLLGLTLPVAAADEPEERGIIPALWRSCFGSEKPAKKADAPAANPADAPPAKKADTPPAKPADPPPAARAGSERQRARDAYFRRLAVCDRLAEIALRTNDLALQRRVERLQNEIDAVREERMAGAAGLERDEAAPEPGAESGAGARQAPEAPRGRAGRRAGAAKEDGR